MTDLTLLLPKHLENMQLPAPELYNYYSDLEERIFWLDDEISTYSLEMAKQILMWNREDKDIPIEERQPIRLVFFSPGGDLDASNALIDVIKLSKTPIWGFNVGQCASGAAFIYLACHKRFMTKKAYFLFHQGSGSFSGTFQEVCSQLESYQIQIQELTQFMIDHTNYTTEEVEDNIIGEWFVYATEALEKGVCDEIMNDVSNLL